MKSKFNIDINHQDDIQTLPQIHSCSTEFGKDVLESQFLKPLLRVSQIETKDLLLKKVLCNIRHIQDGVQSAALTLMRKGHRRCELSQEAAVEEALYLLAECSNLLSADLVQQIKKISQRKNYNS